MQPRNTPTSEYSPDTLERVAGIVGVTGPEEKDRLRHLLCTWRSFWLALERGEESSVAMRESVNLIQERANELSGILSSASERTRGLLAAHAEPEDSPGGLAGALNLRGQARLAGINDSLIALSGWAKKALQELQPPRPGPQRSAALRSAVMELGFLFWELSGDQPTRRVSLHDNREYGPFKEFVEAAFSTFRKPRGLNEAVRDVVRAMAKLGKRPSIISALASSGVGDHVSE